MNKYELTTKYVVKDGHTLGYLQAGSSLMGVLAGKTTLGGHLWENGPVSIEGAAIRPATLEDFEFFRVCAPVDFSHHD